MEVLTTIAKSPVVLPFYYGSDRGIHQLVYELYGLTDEEIRVVEESLG